MNMKTMGFVLALTVLLVSGALAETVSLDLYAGVNQISVPCVPYDSSVLSVFPQASGGNFGAWDPTYGGYSFDPGDPSSFGGLLLGSGYLLPLDADTSVSYEGIEDGVPSAGVKTDMWISLPGSLADNGAMHLVGHPFNHYTPVDDGTLTGANVLFTNGSDIKTWKAAVLAGWVKDQMDGWDATYGGVSVRYDGAGDYSYMIPGQSYWITTYVNNLAMIVLAKPEITP